MEQIMNYIIQFSPAITAVLGIIASMVVTFKKIKGHNEETLKEVKTSEAKIVELNKEMLIENQRLRKENANLKEQMNVVMSHLKHVHTKEE